MTLLSELSRIQKELKAPKGQWNDFSNFHYRSCEDILEAVKPLLGGCVLLMDDDVHVAGDRIYIKAKVTLRLGDESISTSAFAREPLTKKGMDDSQITGTASSYARKYALNGLFSIDDEKDADSMNNKQLNQKPNQNKKGKQSNQDDGKPWYNKPNLDADFANIQTSVRNGMSHDEIIANIKQSFKVSKQMQEEIREID
jgi:hypothetical protein